MSHIISYAKYRNIIRRKIPCIIYFDDSRYLKNPEVLEIMSEMRKTYSLVLCYQVIWLERRIKIDRDKIKKQIYVVCIKENKQKCNISPFNIPKLHSLFKTVCNDCVVNFLPDFNKILTREKGIKCPYNHKLYDIKNPIYDIKYDRGYYVKDIIINSFDDTEFKNTSRSTNKFTQSISFSTKIKQEKAININKDSLIKDSVSGNDFTIPHDYKFINSDLSFNYECSNNSKLSSLVKSSNYDTKSIINYKKSHSYKKVTYSTDEIAKSNKISSNNNRSPVIPDFEEVDLYFTPIELAFNKSNLSTQYENKNIYYQTVTKIENTSFNSIINFKNNNSITNTSYYPSYNDSTVQIGT